MKTNRPLFAVLTFVLVIAVGALPTLAQNETSLMNVRLVTVKQDKVGDWIELQKQLTESMKKAGAPGRSIYEQVKGDHNTFHILTPLEGWSDYDSPSDNGMGEAEWANWVNDILGTIQSRKEFTVLNYDNFSIPAAEGSEPKLIGLWRHRVKQENRNDFYDWYEKKMVPALKKIGVKGRSFGRTILGDDVNTFYHARRLNSYADMQARGFSKLTAAERADLFSAERQSWIVESEQLMLRYRPDLSYSSED